MVHARFLLEHLNSPRTAVRQMARAIKAGGRLILIDDDHENLRFWPESEPVLLLWRSYVESYRVLGNDPCVGRRLVSLLREAGAEPIRTGILPYTFCHGAAGFEEARANIRQLFLEVRALLAETGLIGPEQFEESMAAFEEWRERPDATVWYAIPMAEGRLGRYEGKQDRPASAASSP